MDSLLTDQFAFRPTGSTTAALISIFQKVTILLFTNTYVTIISMDFNNKAFDIVRNSSLVRKLSLLDIPYEIYNWLAELMSDRKHVTRFAGELLGAIY